MLLFLLAAAALLAVARLLAGQREGESAMLAARGATRWQLVRLTAAEAVPLCVAPRPRPARLGVLLARLLARTGGGGTRGRLAGCGRGGRRGSGHHGDARLGTLTPGAARARRGQAGGHLGLTRAGADLALVLLAVVAGWQLRHYSAASAGANGSFGVDPVIVVAPALALAGGTVLALRLLPAGGKAGDRLAARGRGLTTALASWQISRQPIRQGGAALLIVLAVATERSRSRSGRAGPVPTTTRPRSTPAPTCGWRPASRLRRRRRRPRPVPGVRHAMPVAAFPQAATGAETIALDSSQAAT